VYSDLQKHINNVLATEKPSCVVDFSDDDGGELSLCLDDIHPDNFRRDTSGQLFALDFGETNFKSTHWVALRIVGWHLQKYNEESYGLSDGFQSSDPRDQIGFSLSHLSQANH